MKEFNVYDEVLVTLGIDDVQDILDMEISGTTGWIAFKVLNDWYGVLMANTDLIYVKDNCLVKTEEQTPMTVEFVESCVVAMGRDMMGGLYEKEYTEIIEDITRMKQEQEEFEKINRLDSYKIEMLDVRVRLELALLHKKEDEFKKYSRRYSLLTREATSDIIEYVRDNYKEEVEWRLKQL